MWLAVVAVTILVSVANASATPPAEALFDEGQTAYSRGDYATAIAKWTQSHGLSGAPDLLFNIAQAYRLGGDCAHALATYKRFIAIDQKSQRKEPRALAAADDFVRELAPKCGVSTLMPRFERPSGTRGRALRIGGLGTGGGGVALVVTGLLFGQRASSLGDEVSRACAQECDWDTQRDKDMRGRRYSSIGYALDGLGIAAIAGGVAMYYLGNRQSAVHVAPTPHDAGAVVIWSGEW